jgi:hypothetical protein
MNTYLIQLGGPVDETELNATGPIKMTGIKTDRALSSFSVCADQSGLIGLLRHLHARGLVLLSVVREPQPQIPGEENGY